MSNHSDQYDVVVVGASAIGAACAMAVQRALPNARLTVIERAPQAMINEARNERVWALGAAAMDLLDTLEIEQRMDASSCHPYQGMFIWDENSDGELGFDAAELGFDRLGCMVDAELATALLQARLLEHSSIDARFNCVLSNIEWREGHVELMTADGAVLRAQLVIAVDGANSWLRQQAQIPASRLAYQQQGVVARIKTEHSHKNTAWQRFLSTGPVAVLPLADNYSSIVWSTESERASALLACDEAEFEQGLEQALEHRLGRVSLAGRRLSFPLQSRQADRYFANRLVLVGDAAHSIHPLAGQGANLGFQDAIALAECLAHASDIASTETLERYQRRRRPENLQTDFLMTSLHHAYQFNNPLWTLLRGRGMNLISQSQTIKSWFARQAMGLS